MNLPPSGIHDGHFIRFIITKYQSITDISFKGKASGKVLIPIRVRCHQDFFTGRVSLILSKINFP